MSCSEPAAGNGELVSLCEILHAVCREVSGLSQLACDLQATLSPLLPALARDDVSTGTIQGLDLMAQRLDGVAAFLDNLVPGLPGGWLGDALAASRPLTLSDLAHRLACQQPGAPETTVDAGDLCLFET